MPYIKRDRRSIIETSLHLSDFLQKIESVPDLTEGDVNYILSCILSKCLTATPSYAKINMLVGVLECAKLELYRRVAFPYEDRKAQENGDVYTVK